MTDLLDKAKAQLGNLLKKGGKSVLGVDISSSTIKVVQLKKKGGRALLETYGELSLSPYAGVEVGKATSLSSDKLVEALRDLMQEAKVTTNDCGIAIPLSSSLISVIEMPDVGDRRLKDMVPIEMRKFIPVSISEVMLDWRVIPREDDEEREKEGKGRKVDVLVVSIHKKTIDRYQKIVKQAGLASTFFEIEVFSTIRSALNGEPSPVMIIDIGAGTTKIFIIEHKILRQSHIINRGSQDITLALSRSMGISTDRAIELKHTYGLSKEAEDKSIAEVISVVIDNILAEANRVLVNYQKKHQRNIGMVILSGGGSPLSGLARTAKNYLQTETVLVEPFDKVVTPAFLEDVLRNSGPEFAVSMGVALRKLDELK